jgi:hypothetical protein
VPRLPSDRPATTPSPLVQIATSVVTRVLSPAQAVLMASTLHDVGAPMATAVASAVAKGIIPRARHLFGLERQPVGSTDLGHSRGGAGDVIGDGGRRLADRADDGLKVVELPPIDGFAAETSAATVIEPAGHPGLDDARDLVGEHGGGGDAAGLRGPLGRRRADCDGLGRDDPGLRHHQLDDPFDVAPADGCGLSELRFPRTSQVGVNGVAPE